MEYQAWTPALCQPNHIYVTTSEPVLMVLCPEPSAGIHFRYLYHIVTVYVICVTDAL